MKKNFEAIIIEDNDEDLDLLSCLIRDHCPEVLVIEKARTYDEGIKAIEKHEPDLVFLDIELPGGSGFELLENLPKRNFEIIFTTVFDQYAIRGYEFAALDYLIKPIEPLKLRSSIDRLKEESEVSPDSLNHRLQLLSENLNSLNFYSKKIFISLREKMVSVTLADINYIEGDNNKVHVRLINGQSFNHSKTLKYYEKDLFLGSEDKFFRINKSIIINVLGVKEYLTDGTVILPDQIPLFVSPKYRRGLVSILKSFPR